MSVLSTATALPTRLYDGYLFDLDGTVYLGDELLPGAYELICRMRELGRSTLFLSNNPTRDPEMYAEKLGRLGLPTPVSQPGRLLPDAERSGRARCRCHHRGDHRQLRRRL